MNMAPIPNFPNYFATDTGQIVSMRGKNAKIRKTKINKGGYEIVIMSFDKVETTRSVHTLVLEAFVGPRPAGMHACHNDGNKTNNHLSNLRWDSAKSNSDDRRKHETDNIGTRNGRNKLSEAQVINIRNQNAIGVDMKTLAQQFGVTYQQIKHIVLRKQWQHLP